jgi:hypothetical protein
MESIETKTQITLEDATWVSKINVFQKGSFLFHHQFLSSAIRIDNVIPFCKFTDING